MVDIEIVDYDENKYTAAISFNTESAIYTSIDFGLSELEVLKEVVDAAIKQVKENIQKNQDLNKE
jgi:hypothetical protein